MTASTPRSVPSGSRTTGMPPPPAPTTTYPESASSPIAGASRISSGSGDATTRRQPLSPRSSQVWPCSMRAFASVLGQVAADRLGRLGEAGVVAVDEGAGDHGRRPAGRRRARRAPCPASRGSRKPMVALRLRAAPVQRDGRHDVRGELVLDQQVADLGTVAVGQHARRCPGAIRSATCSIAERHGAVLVARRGAAVGPGHGVPTESDQRRACGGTLGVHGSASGRPRWLR